MRILLLLSACPIILIGYIVGITMEFARIGYVCGTSHVEGLANRIYSDLQLRHK
jgi:hypothetical protein